MTRIVTLQELHNELIADLLMDLNRRAQARERMWRSCWRGRDQSWRKWSSCNRGLSKWTS